MNTIRLEIMFFNLLVSLGLLSWFIIHVIYMILSVCWVLSTSPIYHFRKNVCIV